MKISAIYLVILSCIGLIVVRETINSMSNVEDVSFFSYYRML